MTDPLTIGLGLGSILGFGGSSLFGSKSNASPTTPAVDTTSSTLPPDPSTPAIAPGSKPGQKNSQQQSLLSGAAGLQAAAASGGGSSGSGKSLLGQ